MTLPPYLDDALVLATGYLLGCFSAGYYWVRLRRAEDIRLSGSGSTGATNVARVLGWPGFVVTLTLDMLKGAAAVALARYAQVDPVTLVFTMVAVLAGHIWPLQLRLRGGKGMATYFGAVLCFEPRIAAVLVILAASLLVALRNYKLAGLGAVLTGPMVLFFLDDPPSTLFGLSAMAVLILVAHRANIREELGRFTSPNRPKHRFWPFARR
jgi:glycerol-3-phosphate acyltransferase PlsY